MTQENPFMKKPIACLLLLTIFSSPAFCQDTQNPPLTPGWQKMQKNLPPELQEEFGTTMASVLADDKIIALKAESEEAQRKAQEAARAYRQAVRTLLTEKNPALGEKVQEEILKLQNTIQKKQKTSLPVN